MGVQSHLPTRTQRRHLLLWLLGNGHPLQKTRGQDAQPIRCQVLARDLGFQAPLLAFLRERGGRTIHLRQGRVETKQRLYQHDRARGRHCWVVDLHTINIIIIFYHGQLPVNGNRNLVAAIPILVLLVSNRDSILNLWLFSNLEGSFTLKMFFAFVYHFFCLTFLLFYYYTYFVLNCRLLYT